MNYLGIDLGGTNVAAAVVDDAGTILGRASLPTPRGVEPVADAMAAAAHAAAVDAGGRLGGDRHGGRGLSRHHQ